MESERFNKSLVALEGDDDIPNEIISFTNNPTYSVFRKKEVTRVAIPRAAIAPRVEETLIKATAG